MSAIVEATKAEIERTQAERDERVKTIQVSYDAQLERLSEILSAAEAHELAGATGEPPPSPAKPAAPAKPRSRRTPEKSAQSNGTKPGTTLTEAEQSSLDDQVRALIATAGDWTPAGPIYDVVKHGRRAVRMALDRLVEAKRVERRGERAGTRYRIPGSGDSAKPPPSRPVSTRRQSDAERKDADLGSASMRNGTASKIAGRCAAMLLVIRANPGIRAGAAGEKIGLRAAQVSPVLKALKRKGAIREEHDSTGKHLYSAESDVARSDDTGCKTEVERKVFAAVEAAPVALTTSEVAANAGVNAIDTGRVLHGLRRREIVRAVPSRNENSPQRWELPKALAA